MAEFVVHPNRSELGPDQPGHNGHYRVVDRAPRRTSGGRCMARVSLPPPMRQFGDSDGSVTFGGSNWRFVVAAARSFAEDFSSAPVLPPFGFHDQGRWWWWDGSTSDSSILDTLDAQTHVRAYLDGLFPDAGGIDLADLR